MNILDAFGGTQRIAFMTFGILMIIVGVAFIIAGNKGVQSAAGVAANLIPATKPVAAAAAVAGAAKTVATTAKENVTA